MADSQWGGVTFSSASKSALAWVALDPGNTASDLHTAPIDALAGDDPKWLRLASGEDQVADLVLRGDGAYVVTSRNAPRRQVVRTPILHPDLARAEVVVGQSEAVVAPPLAPTDIISSALYLANDALNVRLQEAGVSRLLRLPFEGSARGVVPLPFPGAVHDISADPDEPGLAFALESWVRAPRFYSFDPRAGTVRDLQLMPPHPAERPGLEVIETTARSADGTIVPLTIIGRADLGKDGSHPTRVQGYGAYGMLPEPTFRPLIFPWLERGGIDVVRHPRGGGDRERQAGAASRGLGLGSLRRHEHRRPGSAGGRQSQFHALADGSRGIPATWRRKVRSRKPGVLRLGVVLGATACGRTPPAHDHRARVART